MKHNTKLPTFQPSLAKLHVFQERKEGKRHWLFALSLVVAKEGQLFVPREEEGKGEDGKWVNPPYCYWSVTESGWEREDRLPEIFSAELESALE